MNCGAVLYVEDEENDIVLLQYAWKKAGVVNRLVTVGDGEEAMNYLAGEGQYGEREKFPMPFLVLLDLNLPKETGFNVLKWIRGRPSIHTLQVVVLTSSNRTGDIHRAHTLGANAFVTKPPTSDGLLELAKSLKEFWCNCAQVPPECLQFQSDLRTAST